jgi:hypothetical protein
MQVIDMETAYLNAIVEELKALRVLVECLVAAMPQAKTVADPPLTINANATVTPKRARKARE